MLFHRVWAAFAVKAVGKRSNGVGDRCLSSGLRVKMLDEREGSVAPQELPQSFNRKPVAHRFAIVAAGPAANFLLAILLYWLLFMLGVAAIKPVIGTVPPATPAVAAGFERERPSRR